MALEFSGKNVLLVDGKALGTEWLSGRALTRGSRFHRPRYHLRRNYPDGKGCRRKEGHRRKLRSTYTVILGHFHYPNQTLA